jgi:hypothetical protein
MHGPKITPGTKWLYNYNEFICPWFSALQALQNKSRDFDPGRRLAVHQYFVGYVDHEPELTAELLVRSKSCTNLR